MFFDILLYEGYVKVIESDIPCDTVSAIFYNNRNSLMVSIKNKIRDDVRNPIVSVHNYRDCRSSNCCYRRRKGQERFQPCSPRLLR